ncbi:hypothetical protein [Dyella nitratireducens]|nr:hypothetical protein [Dyella nitratireducens]
MKRFFDAMRHNLPRSTPGALYALILITGCSNAMTSPHFQFGEGDAVRNTFPLKFKEHNFSAFCYNTIGCKVFYAGMYMTRDDDNEKSPPPPPELLKNMRAGHLAIDNFPPPAIVTWRSLDGVAHEAKVDIGAIFKDRRILHHAPEQEIPAETAALDGANIILLVIDRTISVYMKTTIYLKKPRDPSNPLSNTSHEMTLAYTHTY